MGLRDNCSMNSGRPLKRHITKEDIIRRQQSEIEYLKAELDLIKKLTPVMYRNQLLAF